MILLFRIVLTKDLERFFGANIWALDNITVLNITEEGDVTEEVAGGSVHF